MQHQLNDRQLRMIPIAAFTATGDMAGLETALHAGLSNGLTVNEIKEILVQLYAYCGFPRSLNALSTLREVTTKRQQDGITDDLGPTASPLPANWDSLKNGTDNQTQLVGKPVSGPLFDFAPTIDQFLKAHLFGDIFQRDVVDWQMRELATISALAALSGVESQLRSHYSISLNTGLSVEQLQHFTEVLHSVCGAQIASRARSTLAAVSAELPPRT